MTEADNAMLRLKLLFIVLICSISFVAKADLIKPGETKKLTVNAYAGEYGWEWECANLTLHLSPSANICEVYCAAKFSGTAYVVCKYKSKYGTSIYTNSKTWAFTCNTSGDGGDNVILVTGIELNKTSDELDIGETTQLTATVYPSNATNRQVGWLSNNYSVASVVNGLVTAKSVGTAIITCVANDSGNAKAQCTIKVTEKEIQVTRIELNKTSDELEIGTTTQLTATVYPSNATNKDVNWKSSNSSVATVSSSGLVTAKGEGVTNIICTSIDSDNIQAICSIKVKTSGEFSYQGVNYAILDKSKRTCRTNKGSSVSGKLIIPSIVTNGKDPYMVVMIGANSFQNSKDLISVQLPNSIEIIKGYAFYGCHSLSNINFPNGLTTINEYAFYNTGLSSIVFPNGLTYIGGLAFHNCKISNIFIPKSVNFIGGGAFSSQTLRSVVVDSDNENFLSKDGVLYNKAGNELLCYPAGVKINEYTVDNTIKRIGSFCFRNCQISSLVLPNSITSIGQRAFAGSEISKIIIPKSVSIGAGAFVSCHNLSEIYYNTDSPITVYYNVFDDEHYSNTILYVPADFIDKFKQTEPWKYFNKIEAYDFSGVEAVVDDYEPAVYFDLQGVRTDTPVKGRLYIRLQNGKAEKVLVKD